MKSKSIIVLTLGLVLGTFTVKAQDYDYGVFLGGSYYSGDLAPSFKNGFGNGFRGTRPAIGGMARYTFHPNFAVRGNLNFGYVAGYDRNGDDFHKSRNLSFHSPVVELSGVFEWNILKYIVGTKKNWTPFVSVGFGMSYIKPQAYLDGNRYKLADINTEPNKPNQSFIPVIPLTLGVKYNVKGEWTLAAEFGYRKTFTDHLDDVSTTYAAGNAPGSIDARLSNRGGSGFSANPGARRGNPDNNDAYYFVGFTLAKTIRCYKCK